MKRDDVDRRFQSNLLAGFDVENDQVREGCRLLAHGLNDSLPEGREKSLAITNLEQVLFWSQAALARRTDDGAS